ncbi:MAG: Acyl-CoA dehydrogenase, short-chain specific, partial [uncultured Solirubrobacteraceae bacterium]
VNHRRRRGSRRREGSRLLARALAGPARHPRLGPRVRQERRPPCGGRVGRARGDPVADHPGGREDRPLRLRGRRSIARRPDRPDDGDRQRGALLGRRRHRHGDHGHEPRGRVDLRLRDARADGRVHPAVLRNRRRAAGRLVLRLRARRRLRRLRAADDREVRRAGRRVGPQRSEGVGHERRHREHPRDRRHGRPRARLARPGGLRHPAGDARADAGHESQEARPARVAHGRCVPRRLPHPGPLPARRQGQARQQARARSRGRALELTGGDADLRGDAADRRGAGDRHRPRGLRVLAGLREGAQAVRPCDHREPGDRVRARGHEDGDRRGAAARLARVVDGSHRPALHRRRGVDEQAQGRRGGRLGDRARDPDPRRQRLHARVPRRALAPRREDLHDLRGHVGDPATRHRARDLRAADRL